MRWLPCRHGQNGGYSKRALRGCPANSKTNKHWHCRCTAGQFGSGLSNVLAALITEINACKESSFDCVLKPFNTLTAESVLTSLDSRRRQEAISRWLLRSVLTDTQEPDYGSHPSVRLHRGWYWSLSDLAYVDDIASATGPDTHQQTNPCSKGEPIKNKSNAPVDVTPTTLDGVALKTIDLFSNFGTFITNTGQGENEIESRIGKERAAIISLQTCLWSRKEISHRRLRFILLYGCETWPLRVTYERHFGVFDNDCRRRILRHHRADRAVQIRRCQLDETWYLQICDNVD